VGVRDPGKLYPWKQRGQVKHDSNILPGVKLKVKQAEDPSPEILLPAVQRTNMQKYNLKNSVRLLPAIGQKLKKSYSHRREKGEKKHPTALTLHH